MGPKNYPIYLELTVKIDLNFISSTKCQYLERSYMRSIIVEELLPLSSTRKAPFVSGWPNLCVRTTQFQQKVIILYPLSSYNLSMIYIIHCLEGEWHTGQIWVKIFRFGKHTLQPLPLSEFPQLRNHLNVWFRCNDSKSLNRREGVFHLI